MAEPALVNVCLCTSLLVPLLSVLSPAQRLHDLSSWWQLHCSQNNWNTAALPHFAGTLGHITGYSSTEASRLHPSMFLPLNQGLVLGFALREQ